MNSRGFIHLHILIIMVILIGIGAGVYLVQQKTNLFPKAKDHTSTIKPTATPTYRPQILVQPVGLSVVNPFEDVQRTGQPFNKSTYQNPSISGVTFRTSWQDLEPDSGKYNFKILNEVFAQAASHDKWVDLILIPGFGTPNWALEGVQTAQFAVKYGQGQGEKLTLPLPWDETYLNRWFTFLEEINKRYGHRPEFKMISAAGPTSVSSEMSLPNTSEDLLTWQRVGYTPEKYLNAWKKTLAAYTRIFPKQYVSLALYPGLPLPDSSYRDSIRSNVISLGIDNYPRQFALQTSGLNPTKDETEGAGYLIVKSYSSQILTGFMMSTSFTNKQAKYGDPAIALQTSIDRGLAAQAKYIEIYEDDILNPALQDILKDTAERMKGANMTAVSTPTLSVQPSCTPRPACLDSKPRCLIPEPIEGWCRNSPKRSAP